ncbi:MAG: bifunctional oligoribonuclease/PAP phosphatase NrnA [Chlorobi bacterium]|nr:bifunctional oligoribonuclease/PAP phosphatase NrnA [Chlorobiota bacterium]
MKILTKDFKNKIKEILIKDKSILISGHHNPDGDSLGGSLGLAHLLKNAGYDVTVMMPSNMPEYLEWMPGADDILIYEKGLTDKVIEKADIIFFVDFNAVSRTENAAEALKNSEAIKIMLDHHPQPSDDAEFIFSDTKVSSASEIVYEFINMLGFSEYTDKNVATCLFTGIMTDTLNFSVNSSRPETFEIVSNFLSFGIDKDAIYEKVNNNFSLKRLKLIGYLLYKKMKAVSDYKFAYMLISEKELNEFDFRDGDHEGIVNMPLSVSDINVSVLAIEQDDFVKLSLRSKGDYDVNLLARKYFNGGGHKNAAGGRIYKPYEEVEDYILSSVKDYFSEN